MNINIDSTASENTVQFIKYIEENLDGKDAEVTVKTIKKSNWDDLPGDQIPLRNEPTYPEWGVKINISPAEHSVNKEIRSLARSFHSNVLINASHKDEDNIFIFEDASDD